MSASCLFLLSSLQGIDNDNGSQGEGNVTGKRAMFAQKSLAGRAWHIANLYNFYFCGSASLTLYAKFE